MIARLSCTRSSSGDAGEPRRQPDVGVGTSITTSAATTAMIGVAVRGGRRPATAPTRGAGRPAGDARGTGTTRPPRRCRRSEAEAGRRAAVDPAVPARGQVADLARRRRRCAAGRGRRCRRRALRVSIRVQDEGDEHHAGDGPGHHHVDHHPAARWSRRRAPSAPRRPATTRPSTRRRDLERRVGVHAEAGQSRNAVPGHPRPAPPWRPDRATARGRQRRRRRVAVPATGARDVPPVEERRAVEAQRAERRPAPVADQRRARARSYRASSTAAIPHQSNARPLASGRTKKPHRCGRQGHRPVGGGHVVLHGHVVLTDAVVDVAVEARGDLARTSGVRTFHSSERSGRELPAIRSPDRRPGRR